MTIGEKIRYEKLQYDINREIAEISTLCSGNTDKYEYLTSKEVIPPDQRGVIEQGKFTYSALGKALKNKKKNEDQEEKQIKALEDYEKQLVESNEPIKKDINIDKDSIPFEEQKAYLTNLLMKDLLNFSI